MCVYMSYDISGGIRWIKRLSGAWRRICRVQRRPTDGHVNRQVLRQRYWEPRGLAERWTHGMGLGSPCSTSAWPMDLHMSYRCPSFFSSLNSSGVIQLAKGMALADTGTHDLLEEQLEPRRKPSMAPETRASTTSNRPVPAPANPNIDREEQCRQLCWPQTGVLVGCSSTNGNILTAGFIFGEFLCQHFHHQFTFVPTLWLNFQVQLKTPPSFLKR